MMTSEPLVSASFTIAEHTFAALAALLFGAIQLILAHKGLAGTFAHKVLGYFWLVLLLPLAFSCENSVFATKKTANNERLSRNQVAAYEA